MSKLDRFYVEVSGERELIRRFQNLSDKLGDFRDENERVYEEFWKPKMRRVFDSEGAENGAAWDALTPSYAAQKAKRYGAKPINRATDRLERSLTSETGDTVKDIDRFHATFGSSVAYFKYVNAARPIVVISEKDKREITGIFKRDLERFARKQGF